MPTRIDESIFQGIFAPGESYRLTTPARIWRADGGAFQHPTVYVPGDRTLVLDGVEKHFPDGAYVYERSGKIEAVSAKEAATGGVTVNHSSPEPARVNPRSLEHEGNMATLNYYEGRVPGTGRLSLSVTRDQGYGFSFRYPASSAEELVARAERSGAIVKVKDASGDVIEGFFADGHGAVAPNRIGMLANGTDINPGQFVGINRGPGGRTSLYPYKSYSKEEMDEVTGRGQYRAPDNDITKLTDLNGKPLNQNSYPKVNVEPDKVVKTGAPAERADSPKPDGKAPKVDGQPQTGGAQANPPPAKTDGAPKAPDGKIQDIKAPEVPPGEAPVQASESAAGLGRLAKFIAPVALTVAPTVEGAMAGYDAYKKNGSELDIARETALGAGKGVVDTFAPGAADGYSDIVGGGKRTLLDRALNAASDASGTLTAAGSAALLAEGAGVITIPAMIPTAVGTVYAGLTNLGVNAAKGMLKATGLAGKDQDGGYLYEGAKMFKHGVENALGLGAKGESHEEALLRQSAGGTHDSYAGTKGENLNDFRQNPHSRAEAQVEPAAQKATTESKVR